MKTVNLEAGMPFADQAIRRLTYELNCARQLKTPGFKIIHGYGSSGTGGVLRRKLRAYLTRQKAAGKVRMVIEGERLSIFDAETRDAFTYCPDLRSDRDLERHNNGITVIVL